MDDFYEENSKLNPILATLFGDNRFNDLLLIDFTDAFLSSSQQIYQNYLIALKRFDRENLNEKDKINYDVLKYGLEMNIERLSLKDHMIMFNQMSSLPQNLALFGSGTGAQPFKTVKDYDNWLSRAAVFPVWCDSIIVYLKKDIAKGMVLPKTAVEKMIPQMAALISTDATKSTFYDPINKLPNDFSEANKKRLTDAYTKLITEQLNPAYQRLHDFFKNEYLPKARLTSGYSAMPGGRKMYEFYVRFFTTTNKSADEIYNIGLAEVARIQKEMEMVKAQISYTGDLKSFFAYMRSDPKFFPYKTPEEVLNALQSRTAEDKSLFK